jgi:hypothetical protein
MVDRLPSAAGAVRRAHLFISRPNGNGHVGHRDGRWISRARTGVLEEGPPSSFVYAASVRSGFEDWWLDERFDSIGLTE